MQGSKFGAVTNFLATVSPKLTVVRRRIPGTLWGCFFGSTRGDSVGLSEMQSNWKSFGILWAVLPQFCWSQQFRWSSASGLRWFVAADSRFRLSRPQWCWAPFFWVSTQRGDRGGVLIPFLFWISAICCSRSKVSAITTSVVFSSFLWGFDAAWWSQWGSDLAPRQFVAAAPGFRCSVVITVQQLWLLVIFSSFGFGDDAFGDDDFDADRY